MRVYKKWVVIILCIVLFTVSGRLKIIPAYAQIDGANKEQSDVYLPEDADVLGESKEVVEIKEGNLFAQSAVLMDADSGRVLYAKNGEEVLPMASTTKIMTLLVALEEGNLSDVVTVSSYAASMPDVQLNMREGEQYYLKDLLYSLMLESHNDSAVAIAEGVAGSIEAFAQKMNQKAKQIGCENTTFITPNGLDATAIMTGRDGIEREVFHSTTAEDLAKIMSYCITKSKYKEEFLKITRTAEYSFSDCSGNRTFSCRNHNAFLYMMEGALSGKTGFTGKAGYCYVGALEQNGKTFVVALLACGWPNNKTYKWKDTQKLMEYGIDNYEYASFAEAAKDIPKSGSIPVEDGQTDRIGETVCVNWKIKCTGSENEKTGEGMQLDGILLRKDEEIVVEWEVEEKLKAPVSAGAVIGTICYMVGDEVYRTEELVVEQDIKAIDYKWCFTMVLERFFMNRNIFPVNRGCVLHKLN